MTVDEAIRYVESTWVPGAAPTILAAEVRRLRTECPKLIDEIDRDYNRKTNALIARHAKQLYAVVTERDRYLEALTEIAKPWGHEYAVEYVLQGCQEIARDALRGEEE